MKVITKQIHSKTKGAGDFINITDEIQSNLNECGLKEGQATVFVVGSTAAITSFEYEPGLVADLKELYEKLAPVNASYAHEKKWGDANGFSHVRAALQGPSMSIPFIEGKLMLGTWQQVVLAEFDHRPRQRIAVVQFLGE